MLNTIESDWIIFLSRWSEIIWQKWFDTSATEKWELIVFNILDVGKQIHEDEYKIINLTHELIVKLWEQNIILYESEFIW